MIAVLFLIIITQSHATNPYHTWNRQNMLGDNISPCAHPNSFRITSTNMSGGMFSQLQAASVPTTYEDPPSPIIDSTINKTKRRMRKKEVNTRYIPAHKFTAAMQQQADLHTNIALYQEASGGFNASNMANKFSGKFEITHAPGHKKAFGLAYSTTKDSRAQIFGGSQDNTGSIQSIFLGSGRTKGKQKKYVTIFNIYAPTTPTASVTNLARYHAWLDD